MFNARFHILEWGMVLRAALRACFVSAGNAACTNVEFAYVTFFLLAGIGDMGKPEDSLRAKQVTVLPSINKSMAPGFFLTACDISVSH